MHKSSLLLWWPYGKNVLSAPKLMRPFQLHIVLFLMTRTSASYHYSPTSLVTANVIPGQSTFVITLHLLHCPTKPLG